MLVNGRHHCPASTRSRWSAPQAVSRDPVYRSARKTRPIAASSSVVTGVRRPRSPGTLAPAPQPAPQIAVELLPFLRRQLGVREQKALPRRRQGNDGARQRLLERRAVEIGERQHRGALAQLDDALPDRAFNPDADAARELLRSHLIAALHLAQAHAALD